MIKTKEIHISYTYFFHCLYPEPHLGQVTENVGFTGQLGLMTHLVKIYMEPTKREGGGRGKLCLRMGVVGWGRVDAWGGGRAVA